MNKGLAEYMRAISKSLGRDYPGKLSGHLGVVTTQRNAKGSVQDGLRGIIKKAIGK